MGKLIVNEQDVKRIVDESTTNETGIINQFVNKEIQAEVNKLHLDLSNYNLKHREENNEKMCIRDRDNWEKTSSIIRSSQPSKASYVR